MKKYVQPVLVVLAVLGGIQKSFAPSLTGSLQVNLLPPAVVTAGAKWQLDSGPSQYTNGETLNLISTGLHTVSFTPVAGWSTPSNALVSIVFNQTTITNGTYVLTNAPALAVSLTANTAMVSWPSPSTGWTLQQNTDLTTTNWSTPPEAVTDNGTIKYIIVNPPMGNLFYRLLQP